MVHSKHIKHESSYQGIQKLEKFQHICETIISIIGKVRNSVDEVLQYNGRSNPVIKICMLNVHAIIPEKIGND